MASTPILSLAKAPFLLHDVIATTAAVTFIFRPERQLQPLTESGRLILQSYGGCLLFTSLVSLIFLTRPVVDETTRLAALAFTFWHAWPSYRAIVRMQRGIDTKGEMAKTLGGPLTHLAVHTVLFVGFLYTAFSG